MKKGFLILFLLLSSMLVTLNASMLEETMLRNYSDVVFRPDSMTLCIIISEGDTVFFRNTTIEQYSDSFSEYRLVSYLPEQNYWALERMSYEWMDWLVLNGDNGWKKKVISEPWPSPDGSRLYCAMGNLYIEYMENGVQIWRVDEDSLVLEFEDLDVNWEPNRTGWLSDSILTLDKVYYEFGSGEYTAEPGRLVLSADGEWIPDDEESWE